jgi:hypothetical protein
MNEITISWQQRADSLQWHTLCASVVEHFGLPGDRYTSHPTENNMQFVFKNDHDAFLCKILLSESL